MTHVTCRLTAKNRDQLRNPTLGNRVRGTFTFLCTYKILKAGNFIFRDVFRPFTFRTTETERNKTRRTALNLKVHKISMRKLTCITSGWKTGRVVLITRKFKIKVAMFKCGVLGPLII